jgi:hypothetical protein
MNNIELQLKKESLNEIEKFRILINDFKNNIDNLKLIISR